MASLTMFRIHAIHFIGCFFVSFMRFLGRIKSAAQIFGFSFNICQIGGGHS